MIHLIATAPRNFMDAARACVHRTERSWAESSRVVRATTVLLGLLLVAGIVLRIRDVAFPPYFTFDEELFVPSGHRYLLGLKDNNDHPPLFKLFVSVGLLLFGYNASGWRFPALCFGIQSILLAYWLGKALFKDARAGLFAAAFLACDGFFLSYSRVGLMDGILTTILLWTMVAAAYARTWRGVLVTALLVGVATSVKWSGVLIAIPAIATMRMVGRISWPTFAWFFIVPVIHLGVWVLALSITGEPADVLSILKVVLDLVQHHVDLNKGTNPLASTWYTWFVFFRPVVIKYSSHGFTKRYASTLGNPAFWVTFDLLVCALPVYLAVRLIQARGALKQRFAAVRASLLEMSVTRPIVLLMTGWVVMVAPWTKLRTQYSFLHYYLPSYGFALLILAGLAAALERKRPTAALACIGVVFALTVYFMPIWAEFPMSESAAFHRLIFTPWRP